jgi:hypothetical protein
MKTTVVNLRRAEFDAYVGRPRPGWPSEFGNPSRLSAEKDRVQAIAEFREYFYKRLDSDPIFKRKVIALRGKRLGCFCAPKPCHADVIAEYLNQVDLAA